MTKTNYVRGPRQNHVYLFITTMKLIHSKAAYVLWDAVGLETWTQATRPHIGHDKLNSVVQPAQTLLATTEAQNQVECTRLLDVAVRGQSREHRVSRAGQLSRCMACGGS